ncbi:MAG: tetratricopeptide repeat protein [Elusimicrobiales bacterium]|nr:tetratricopeptide repeat protein [Elusimicrobiales bacterium]
MKLGLTFKTAALLIALAAAIALRPLLDAGFTNWDDDVYVTNNTAIKELSPQSVRETLTSFHKGLYKPLVMLSFMAEYKLFELNPKVYHADNLLLHIANCLLAAWLALSLLGSAEAALAAGLLFGLHPLHVESVAWVSERKDLLFTLFFLAALAAWLRYRKNGARAAYWASAAFLLCSLMAKPQGFILPPVLLLLDWYQGRRLDQRALLDKLPHALLCAFFLALALFSINRADAMFKHPELNLFDRLCVASYGLLAYVKRLFLPFGLSAVYPYPDKTGMFLPWRFAIAPFAAAAFFGALLWFFRKNRDIVLGVLFFLITVAPGLQFMPIAPTVAFDHYTYLAYTGIFIAAGAAFARLSASAKAAARYAAWTALAAIAIALGSLSYVRAGVWRNSITLWNDVLEKYPGNQIALNNRAVARLNAGEPKAALIDIETAMAAAPKESRNYLNRGMARKALGDIKGALADFSSAIELEPGNPDAYVNRGNFYNERGDLKAAMTDYESAIRLDPLKDGAYNNLAGTCYKLGDARKALLNYSIAVKLNPGFADAWLNRGLVCLSTGNTACAISDLSRAARLAPHNAEIYAKRGLALALAGRAEKALADYSRALSLDPKNAETFFNRGFVEMTHADMAGAESDFGAALRLRPDYAAAYMNRAGVYFATRRYDMAVKDFSKALELEPGSAQAYNNRGLARAAQGKMPAALSDFGKAIALRPDYAKAYANRAALRLKLGLRAACLSDAKKALALNPGLAAITQECKPR